MLLSDFIDCVPHNQEVILLIHCVEVQKSLDSILEKGIDVSKYRFDNIEHILASEIYYEYKEYYIDNVYAYRDILYIYIIDRG